VSKLAEWSDNEEEVETKFAPKKNKWAKNVIVKNMFSLSDLADDKDLYNEIVDDVREAGERFGEITKCVLYDEEPEGIVVARFKDFESAEAFQKKYDGRRWGDRQVKITIAEDRPKFKKSKRDGDSDDDQPQKQQKDDPAQPQQTRDIMDSD
jgi:HIV Tat-specific factor 1